ADPARYLAAPGAHGMAHEMPLTISAPIASPAPVPRQGSGVVYTCPMDPDVRKDGPGSCPKCGMALEPLIPVAAAPTTWTCPMHPQTGRDSPGTCPICGMALEPRTPTTAGDAPNPELVDMTRRFWIALALSAPLVLVAMGHAIPGWPLAALEGSRAMAWLQ